MVMFTMVILMMTKMKAVVAVMVIIITDMSMALIMNAVVVTVMPRMMNTNVVAGKVTARTDSVFWRCHSKKGIPRDSFFYDRHDRL
jgi:hypothetical protein